MKSSIFESVDHAMDYLVHEADILGVRCVANVVLENDQFKVWTGASKPSQHHYGEYGLLMHTAEVVKLCLNTNETFNNIANKTLLYYAALFHDIGKIWDYSDWESNQGQNLSTWHKYAIHHIFKSSLIWENASLIALEENLRAEVTHAIIAHHGLREWGSPVPPRTSLAWILHLCDGLSARLYETKYISCTDLKPY